MADEGGAQEHLFDLAFPPEPDLYLPFGNDVPLPDATCRAVGYMLDTGDIHYHHHAPLLPMAPSETDVNDSYSETMATIDGHVFQSTSYVYDALEDVTQLHLLLPGMACPETDNIRMQEAPVLHGLADGPDGTINDNQMTSLAFPVGTRYATAEDWERHRDMLTRLYLDENKTLKQIKSIMEKQHDFHATDKMYKTRFKKWQLRKNCKALEKEEVLRCVEANRNLGLDLGEPMVNGRSVKMHIVERHRQGQRRARSPSPSITGVRSAKRARPGIPMCATSISFSRIKDPTEYRNYEVLLLQLDYYYNANLDSEPPLTSIDGDYIFIYKRVEISYMFQGNIYACVLNGPWDVFQRCKDGVDFLSMNRPREAWKMIQEGAEMVLPSLQQSSLEFTKELLEFLSVWLPTAYAGVKTQLLHLISDMASVVHGDRHPISNICRLLEILHGKEEAIELSLRKVRDVFQRRLGQNHALFLAAQERLCEMMMRQKRYAEAERSILSLISICESSFDRNSPRTRNALVLLARVYYSTSRYLEAENVFEDVLQRGQELGKGDP